MIGTTLAHYRILAKIGAGSMGDVYRAHDTRLGRDVAIKALPADSARNQELRQRFQREAKAIAKLKHPNIVTIHSVEEVDGVHFITMELIEGQTLSEILPADGLPLERFFEISLPLAKAVSYAHAQGITHRDLKPANIMLDGEGGLKILDFGLAKLWSPEAQSTEETLTGDELATTAGHILGTVAYMSPEQITGGEIGGWSDIFSLGIVFYELLSGGCPFCGDYLTEILHKIVNDEPPHLTSLPTPLWTAIERCLKKSPRERFASAGELHDTLEGMTGTTSTVIDFEFDEPSTQARLAFEQEDWERAYREFQLLGEQRDLSPGELEMTATCASWLGEFDEWFQTMERAYRMYAKSGSHIDAARTALILVGLCIERNANTVASGWLKRAERLLQDEPDCVEHGYLLRRQTMMALAKFDLPLALELNRQCSKVADRFQDLDLQTEALHDRGQILVAGGDVEEGTECVDEAMISAVSGDVNPTTLGNLYCRTMVVCRSLSDFKRVREWSEEAWRWSEPNAASGYLGLCQIHSAETMRHLGQWEKAEQAIRSACSEFEGGQLSSHAGEAFNELGELTLRQGKFQEAEEAFQRAHEFGCDPVPGLPLLRLAQGKGGVAQQSIQRALNENRENHLHRGKLLSAAIPIALANNDLSRAQSATDELGKISQEFSCRCFDAHALAGQGALELERGDHDAASRTLHRAWSAFNELGYPYDAARLRTLLATAYLKCGNDEDAKLQLGAAHKIFSELGARLDLTAVTELLHQLP